VVGKNRSKARSRYRELADALIASVRTGRTPVGSLLPGELELAATYRVSRHTVREALRLLGELGLIHRQPGVGTVIRAQAPVESYVQTVRTPAELLQYPPESRLVVVATAAVRVPRALAADLQVVSGSLWQQITCIRRMGRGQRPIAWVDLYVPPEYAGIAESIGSRKKRVYEMFAQRFGLMADSVEVSIQAGALSAAAAQGLDAEQGAPTLRLVRRYRTAEGKLFMSSVSEHPADRFTYTLTLRRGWQSDRAAGWSTI
jgi:GntR family transcriptional regulator